jgi:hypothetical protein
MVSISRTQVFIGSSRLEKVEQPAFFHLAQGAASPHPRFTPTGRSAMTKTSRTLVGSRAQPRESQIEIAGRRLI